METIFALSSGAPPAAIAVIRISGTLAASALNALGVATPEPRAMRHVALRDPADGTLLDRGLAVWFPGPNTATGEDCAELHLHGGRAVVAAVSASLARLPGLRPAQPGEFTRRAFLNGRIDLAEAEGLADLLAAETDIQRRSALAMANGALSRSIEAWREAVLGMSAAVEARLDFEDEDDVPADLNLSEDAARLADEIGTWLDAPSAEMLRDGFHVVLAGPPNVGKSTLFNALVADEAAITADTPGTTRDLIERTVAIEGVPFRFTDTAGLRDSRDAIEAIGVARARSALEAARLVLWLGPSEHAAQGMIDVASRVDIAGPDYKSRADVRVSAVTGEGLGELRERLLAAARSQLGFDRAAINQRQRDLLASARDAIAVATEQRDLLIVAEHLRQARVAFDQLIGRSGVEDMLDGLFGRFCIGK